jgi:capsular polysaccharide biosynthesis protein
VRPEEIAATVARRWWIIAIGVVVAALIGYLGTSTQPKTYTVSARIMAIADPPDYWLDLYAKNRLASYKDLISNWTFVSEALAATGSSIDPGLAQSTLALGHNPDANIVQIVSTDTDPQRAADIVNALADGFVARNDADNQRILERPRPVTAPLPGVVTMLKLDTPTAPSVASGPRVKVNTLAAAILGGVAGLIVVFATIYFDDTLKQPADLERYIGLPLLVLVPVAKQRQLPLTSDIRGGAT